MPARQDSGLPVTTTCGPEPRVSWTSHTVALTVLPCPLWGSQGQPYAPTIPPLHQGDPGRAEGPSTGKQPSALQMTDRVEDFVQDHHANFLSLDPGPQGPPPPSSRAPRATHSRGLCFASPAVCSGARWCLVSSHNVEKLLVSSTLSPNERKQAPECGPGSLDGPSRKDGWAQSPRVPSPSPCRQLQPLPDSSFPEAAKLQVSSEPRPFCPL